VSLDGRIRRLEAVSEPIHEPCRTVIVTTEESPSLPPPGLVAAFEADSDHSQLILLWDGRALVSFEEWLRECEAEHRARLDC
jgi:hypothetical protein